MSDAKLEAYFFTAIFLIALVLVGVLFYPFLGSLAFAVVLATLVSPFYKHLHGHIKNENLSAFLMTIIVLLAIMLPATGLFYLLVEELNGITEAVTQSQLQFLPSFLAERWAKILELFPFLKSLNLAQAQQSFLDNLGSFTATAFKNTAGIFFKFFIALIAFFYFIKDGKKFIQESVNLSPLKDVEDQAIVSKLRAVTQSLIQGTLVVAVLQGLFTGLGFLMFGIPNPVLWGSIAAVSALVPTLGTSIVSLPAIVYLLATGEIVAGFGLLAWATLLVGLIDNIIGPKLMGRGMKMHPLFVLLSVLGGLALFGISGFILGPLLFGFLIALSEIYKIKVREIHDKSIQV